MANILNLSKIKIIGIYYDLAEPIMYLQILRMVGIFAGFKNHYFR